MVRAHGSLDSNGNGLVELRDYDQQGRLVRKELMDNAGFAVDERTWTYDPAGNVIERTSSSSTENFAYDALDRLVGQDAIGGNEASWSYAYGPNHNRQARSKADQRNELYSYRQGSNRLSTIDRFVAQLETDSPASVQFDYNQAGRLSEYSENGEVKARYTYNTFGLRTRKETDAGTTVFHYDTGITLLGESDEAGNTTRDYIWLNGSPVAMVDAADGDAYIHTDHLLTPRLATDGQGAIVWAWEGEAFGDAKPTGSRTLNLRFPGQYFDADSRRHYNVMRDYDSALGRYMQSDPIGLAGELNYFLYAGANSTSHFDLFGLFCISQNAINIIAAGVGGGVSGAFTGTAFGVLAGIAAGAGAEFAGQQFNGSNSGFGPGPALGRLAGFSAGGSRGGRFGGALGGAASSVFSGTEPNASSDFRDTPAGGLGGFLGGIGGEFFNTGSNFNLFRGGGLGAPVGFAGGFASDLTRGVLERFSECEEEGCE